MSLPVAIVTGASRGIGRSVALELARNGFVVVANYVQSEVAAQELVREIESAGGQAIAARADVSKSQDRMSLVQAATDRFGRLDVLINNAGITSPGRLDLLDATESNWDLVMDTNLKGPFFLGQVSARAMIDSIRNRTSKYGTIINVSSISAYAVSTNRVDYCIAKAGLGMMTHLFATRLADENIRVYEICPGVIASDMTAPVREKYDRLIADGLSPIRRWGEPRDVAAAVLSLVRGDFAFSTGDRFNIDGGFHIRRL